jgi:hypothetical protein
MTVDGTKVLITDQCDARERERLTRYFQDALGWKEGQEFSIQHPIIAGSQTKESDELRTCSDCGSPFTFSIGEQHYFAQNNLAPTKRCPDCRKRRKADKQRGDAGKNAFSHR